MAPTKRGLTKAQVARVLELRASGSSWKMIAYDLGVNYDQVKYVALKHGLRKPRGTIVALKHGLRKPRGTIVVRAYDPAIDQAIRKLALEQRKNLKQTITLLLEIGLKHINKT